MSFSWEKNKHAVLGTVYLYFAHGCDENQISSSAMSAFIAAHQDAKGSLTESAVRAAINAVRKLDTGSGHFRSSGTLEAIWTALLPLRSSFPT